MSINVQPFVIDEAVLDLIGNEFKFDHAKGLAEWIKNSCDAYLREETPDDEQHIILRLTEDKRGMLSGMECIDFVGMDRKAIDEAFKRFFDPEAAKKGAKQAQVKTLGGHGNGGKFYMRQMFKESIAITYKNGRLNIFGFNDKKQYGFDTGGDNIKMSPKEAMTKAGIQMLELPGHVKDRICMGETGFTVVRGAYPRKAARTSTRYNLLEKLRLHPQARRLIEHKPIMLVLNSETKPNRLTAPKIEPKDCFEKELIIPIPETMQFDGVTVAFKNDKYPDPGKLILRTSKDPLRGNLTTLNTIDFIGELGVVASYRIHELGQVRYSGEAEFIYGECECPILEDPENDCVRNDRQKLIENERSEALCRWVRDQIEGLAEKMELKIQKDKKKQDLKNTSVFNEILNRWKNRFMNKIWSEVFIGKGPEGESGNDPGERPAGKGEKKRHGKAREGTEGGSATTKKPRFPRVLVSGKDTDPLDPMATEPFHCDPRHPAVYQRTKDVGEGIYWINTSRSLAEKIISEYTSDSTRWREYMFQRYVDIITKEAIFQLGKLETSLSSDDVNRCIDDVVTKIHDQAAQDLSTFLFDEKFNVGQ